MYNPCLAALQVHLFAEVRNISVTFQSLAALEISCHGNDITVSLVLHVIQTSLLFLSLKCGK